MFVARQSDHIQEDIKRNWSSWNFGQDGFTGTEEELNELLDWVDAEENNSTMISGFEIFDTTGYEFAELYNGYWVAKDGHGLSAIELDADNEADAIEEATERSDYFGEGVKFDAQKAKLVWSHQDGDIHIFEIEDTI